MILLSGHTKAAYDIITIIIAHVLAYQGSRRNKSIAAATTITILPPLTAMICTRPLSIKLWYCSLSIKDLSPMMSPRSNHALFLSDRNSLALFSPSTLSFSRGVALVCPITIPFSSYNRPYSHFMYSQLL